MKKLILMVLMITFGTNALSSDVEIKIPGKCPIKTGQAKLDYSQKSWHDEFLYFGDYIYECDNEYCKGDTEVELPAGHMFLGQEKDTTIKYRCRQGGFLGEDRWEVLNDDTTTTVQEDPEDFEWEKGCGTPVGKHRYKGTTEWWMGAGQEIQDDEFIYAAGKVYECQKGYCDNDTELCFEPGHIFKGEEIANAQVYKCKGNRIWEAKGSAGKSCADLNQEGGIGTPPATEEPEKKKQKTADKSAANAAIAAKNPCDPSVCRDVKCKTCCQLQTQEKTKWSGTYCTCLDGGIFAENPETKKWSCMALDAGTYKCQSESLALLEQWQKQCVNKTEILSLIQNLQKHCQEKPNKATFDTLFNTIQQSVESQCVKTDNESTIKISITKQTNRVNDIYGRLVSIHNKFRDEKSVWRDKDGNFNTARLASDSIAGVVLGTTGALVTSHVVKKNQVENGFEDIKCTIGGQNVSQWGDQFRVGIQ